jgi:ribose/xylose/arabinose/galactoside ABC-type transport system permease subunit/ABC-type branched-subunit amino acid transport system ATPase component
MTRTEIRRPLASRAGEATSVGLRSRRTAPGEASSRVGLGILAIGLFAFFSVQFGENYYSLENIAATALAMSSIAIAVTGSMALIISGNVDLSIGSMFALDAVIIGEVAARTQSTPLAVVVGIVTGAALGGLNGILVRALRLSPLIVTIATLALYGGIAFAITGGQTVFGFPASFDQIGQAKWLGVQIPVYVAAVIFVVGAFTLVSTRLGLRIYAIGGNKRSAELAGIPVARTTVGLYAANGALIGVVALLAAAQLGSADPVLGTNFEFDVLTAAILGGVAFTGGAGRPLGVFFGIAMIGIVNSGLVFEGLQSYWQQIVQGGLLLLALGLDQVLQPRRASRRQRHRHTAQRPDGNSTGSSPKEKRPQRPRRNLRSPILEAQGLTKYFGASTALNEVDLRLHEGEVLCLIGDNGAGKSTLIKILSGALQSDAGEIAVEGHAVSLQTPRDANDVGIRTVFQDLAVCENLSVTHNLALGEEPVSRLARLIRVRDDAAAACLAKTRLSELSITLSDYNTPVGSLSGGQRQSVAIARAMDSAAKIVILDEPTAALGVAQTQHVLDLVDAIAAAGTGVILISHDIETILSIADTVVVLRLGQVIHHGPVDRLDALSLMHLMSGGERA